MANTLGLGSPFHSERINAAANAAASPEGPVNAPSLALLRGPTHWPRVQQTRARPGHWDKRPAQREIAVSRGSTRTELRAESSIDRVGPLSAMRPGVACGAEPTTIRAG